MNEHSVVYVLVGQRAAGKSTYAKKLVERQPGLRLISRDDLLMKEFGRIDSDHYSGNLEWGEDETWRQVALALETEANQKIILDHWTWSGRDREILVGKLRKLGASKVIALYFKTPVELVNEWFWQKPKIAKASETKRIGFNRGYTFFMEDAPLRDYENFHRLAETITTDGFDLVVEVNPLVEPISV